MTPARGEHRSVHFAPEQLDRLGLCILGVMPERERRRAAAVVLAGEHSSAQTRPVASLQRLMATRMLNRRLRATGGPARAALLRVLVVLAVPIGRRVHSR